VQDLKILNFFTLLLIHFQLNLNTNTGRVNSVNVCFIPDFPVGYAQWLSFVKTSATWQGFSVFSFALVMSEHMLWNLSPGLSPGTAVSAVRLPRCPLLGQNVGLNSLNTIQHKSLHTCAVSYCNKLYVCHLSLNRVAFLSICSSTLPSTNTELSPLSDTFHINTAY